MMQKVELLLVNYTALVFLIGMGVGFVIGWLLNAIARAAGE